MTSSIQVDGDFASQRSWANRASWRQGIQVATRARAQRSTRVLRSPPGSRRRLFQRIRPYPFGQILQQPLHAMLLHGHKVALIHQGAKPAFPILLVHAVDGSGRIGTRNGPDHVLNVVELAIG
ncbi:MAG: hypothetical protein JWR14_504 [Caballeronia sp.]|jgi:hypothetical protein|nr:hypothetical protein [Caballeronia sp.]